ncbi:MAG: class I SAM-dependent methyltransferase [Candidatus Cloacimonetes bacterium]|nr:class I SAM-dependent methyltransferase [Candidatus Cloacimonadota bacterium]
MSKEIDWSNKKWKEALIDPRKNMWTPEQVEKVAGWAGLKHSKKVLDVGCGIGYLGSLFLEYYNNTHYTGIDISTELLKEAREYAENNFHNISFEFKEMDCYSLQYDDNTFDTVMCQTLLMHLEYPQKAVDEMVRVLKPGGVLLCMEPDNATSEIKESFNNHYEFTIEQKIIFKRVALHRIKGQKLLKRGDWGIGTKLPYLFYNAKLQDIDMLQNEKINFLVPPYSRPEEKIFLKKYATSAKTGRSSKQYWQKRHKEEFIAGGGSEYLYRQFCKLRRDFKDIPKQIQQRVEEHDYVFCSGPSLLFACKGVKPSN